MSRNEQLNEVAHCPHCGSEEMRAAYLAPGTTKNIFDLWSCGYAMDQPSFQPKNCKIRQLERKLVDEAYKKTLFGQLDQLREALLNVKKAVLEARPFRLLFRRNK